MFLTYFVDSIIRSVQSTVDAEHSLFIPSSLFDEDKPFFSLDFVKINTDVIKKIPSFLKWKIPCLNKMDYKESKEFSIKRQ